MPRFFVRVASWSLPIKKGDAIHTDIANHLAYHSNTITHELQPVGKRHVGYAVGSATAAQLAGGGYSVMIDKSAPLVMENPCAKTGLNYMIQTSQGTHPPHAQEYVRVPQYDETPLLEDDSDIVDLLPEEIRVLGRLLLNERSRNRYDLTRRKHVSTKVRLQYKETKVMIDRLIEKLID
jgi:hypothetical protein